MRGSGSIINRFSNMEKRLTGITMEASINDVIIFQGEGSKLKGKFMTNSRKKCYGESQEKLATSFMDGS